MTDFSAFAPDPIADDVDPFAADGQGQEDPFASHDAPDGGDDPFGAPHSGDDDPFGQPSHEAIQDDMGGQGGQEDPFAGDSHDEQETYQEQQGGYEDDAFGVDEPDPVASLGVDEEEVMEQKQDSYVLPESTVQGQWQSDRSEVLRQRRDEARDKKEAAKDAAKATLKQFYDDRDARLGKVKATNREEEKNVQAEMASLMEFGSTWEKVHKLVNLQPKPNEKPGSSRVDRMRNLLIQLKHEK